jgi:enoyl-CoA hydratase
MSRFSKRFNAHEGAEYIRVEKDTEKCVAWITFARPEKLNALNVEMREYLNESLWRLETDDDVRVTVLRSEGRAFTAGHDLSEERTWNKRPPGKKRIGMTENHLYFHEILGGNVGYASSLRHFSKVLIGQVHGLAYGGGFSMIACACDILVIAEDASVGSPQVRFTGLGPGPWQSVGYRAGKWIGSSGEPITGALAQELGLAHIVCPRDKLEETVDKLAGEIAQRPLNEILFLKARFNAAETLMGRGRSAEGGGGFTQRPDEDEPNFWRTVGEQGLKAGLDKVYSAAPRVGKVLASPDAPQFQAGGAGREHTAEERLRDRPRDH